MAAAQVTEAATRAEAVRKRLACRVSSLWRCPQAKLLSEEGAETLDLATAVVAMAATALGEMRSVAARQLDWANWQLIAGERQVRRVQAEETCIVRAHRLWEAVEASWWAVLAAAVAAAADEVDADGEAAGRAGPNGGTDPGNDEGGGVDAKRDGSRGQDGGSADGSTDDGGSTGNGGNAAWDTWVGIGDGGRWLAQQALDRAVNRGKLGVDRCRGYRVGVEWVGGGGRRRRGCRRMRPLGWRRWLAPRGMGSACSSLRWSVWLPPRGKCHCAKRRDNYGLGSQRDGCWQGLGCLAGSFLLFLGEDHSSVETGR